jgi:hypothetical protein
VDVGIHPRLRSSSVEPVDELGACVPEGNARRAVLQNEEIGVAERTREHRPQIALD